MSAAQGPIANGPALLRIAKAFGVQMDLERPRQLTTRILGLLDSHLAGLPFLVGAGPSLADVAVYSYVAASPEGGVDLAPYAAIAGWLERIEALPNFIPMPRVGAKVGAAQ